MHKYINKYINKYIVKYIEQKKETGRTKAAFKAEIIPSKCAKYIEYFEQISN